MKKFVALLIISMLCTSASAGELFYEDFEDPDNLQVTLAPGFSVADGYLKGPSTYSEGRNTSVLDGTYPPADLPIKIEATFNHLDCADPWDSIKIVIGRTGDAAKTTGLCAQWSPDIPPTYAGPYIQVQGITNNNWNPSQHYYTYPDGVGVGPDNFDENTDYVFTVIDYGDTVDVSVHEAADPGNIGIVTDIDVSGYPRDQGDYIGTSVYSECDIGIDDIRVSTVEPPAVMVGIIDPCSISLTEDPCDTPSATYTITLTEQPPAGAAFAVYLDPCDLWADGLKQVTVLPAKAGDPNTGLDIVFDSTNWDTTVTVTVTAYDDSEGEESMDLALNHSLVLVSGSVNPETDPNWTNPGLINSPLAVAIADDDQRYAVTVDELGGLSVSEQGPASDDFTVVIEIQPTFTLTVDIATDGQTSLSSNALVFDNVNWNVAQTVTVTAAEDTVGEDDPHTSDITYSVDAEVITWNPLYSDNFNNTLEDGWTTLLNDGGDTGEPNALHDGTKLTTYGSTLAIAPGDFIPPYRLTVDNDLSGTTYNIIYLRNNGTEIWHDNDDMIRIGFWAGGGDILVCNVGGTEVFDGPVPGWGTDPKVYTFIVTDLGNSVTVRMENKSNPSNYLEITNSGNYSSVGASNKIGLGVIEDHGASTAQLCTWDDFSVEQAAAGQDEKIAWLNAPIEYPGGHDGDAEVDDNDCSDDDYADNDADFDDDCDIDLADLFVFVGQYLDCLKPNSGICN